MGLWTTTHLYQILPTFFIFALIALVAKATLGRCARRVKYIPLQIIAVLLLALEVFKQINSFGSDGTYNLYSLPFHYCSLFLYFLPFHAFYHGRYSYITDAVSFGCLASLTVDMLIMPAVIYSDGNIRGFFGSFGDFHTVAFHNLVVLYFMLTIALGLYELRVKRDLKVISIFLAVYVTIAAVMSYSLKENYHNLYKCNIQFIEDVRLQVVDKIGVVGTVMYVCIMFVLTILFAFLAYFIASLVIRAIDGLSKKKTG